MGAVKRLPAGVESPKGGSTLRGPARFGAVVREVSAAETSRTWQFERSTGARVVWFRCRSRREASFERGRGEPRGKSEKA